MELVWTNPSDLTGHNNFSAQDIYIDLSKYTSIEIVARGRWHDDNTSIFTFLFDITETAWPVRSMYYNYGTNIKREFSVYSDHLSFGPCYVGSVNDSSYLTPVKIYGIK